MSGRKIWTDLFNALRQAELELIEARRQADVVRRRRDRLREAVMPRSRQSQSAAHVKAQGKCSQCGQERGRPGALCPKCLEKSRVRRMEGVGDDV